MPNGYGSIKFLGKNRRKPYGVYPPATEYTEKGPVTPKALGYTETWEEAYELLTVYNMEKEGKIKTKTGTFIDRSPTFAEVFEDYYAEKYKPNPKKTYSKQSMQSTRTAFNNCSALHKMQVAQIKYKDLQDVLNNCPLKHSSLELIATLFHQMYKYMMKYEIVDTDYSIHVTIPVADDDESGEPFSEKELCTLWENSDDEVVQMILIMCYSGFRIAAYTKMETSIKDWCFCGGVKTKASKGRTVPIHTLIRGFVAKRNPTNLLECTHGEFRLRMYKKLEELGIDHSATGKKHTPHDCRHTFSALCEKYGVNENDRKRMMGHSFGSDITNAKYGHRTVEELRAEIEKIQLPDELKKNALPKCC